MAMMQCEVTYPDGHPETAYFDGVRIYKKETAGVYYQEFESLHTAVEQGCTITFNKKKKT
jgi:uncharacterized protein YigE (DUF2233 family)